MRRSPPTTLGFLVGLCAVCALGPASASKAAELYFTDFDEFAAGPDEWAGTNGWLGTSSGVGAHGIDNEIIPGLEKTAYIGSAQPASTFVTVFRPENVDAVAEGTPIMAFESLMGIQDSSTLRRDSFFFTFYNMTGDLLASIRFSNEEASFGIWRLDGTSQFDTDVEFIRGELHLLYAEIDFANNLWSADLDGIPLFTDAPFNATGKTLNFGSAAAEWQLTAGLPAGFGDNWMLVADWSLRTVPEGETPFLVKDVGLDLSGQHTMLSWTGEPGFEYQVQYAGIDSNSLWQSDLPGSFFTNLPTNSPLSYTDSSSTGVLSRLYRVLRSVMP